MGVKTGDHNHHIWVRWFGRGVLVGVIVWLFSMLACASTEKSPATDAPVSARPQITATQAIDSHIAKHPVNFEDPNWKTRLPRPPTVSFDSNVDYYWFLHTSEGGIKIKLKPEWAPAHVSSTIYLTRLGFYDGLSFHRIIPKFMAQGGDPLGTGAGGPGYRMGGEFSRRAKHSKRGVVSAANSGPRTDGSQFFIMFTKDGESLDGKHTVYGQVVEGMGTLTAMERAGTESGEPRKSIIIRRAEILED